MTDADDSLQENQSPPPEDLSGNPAEDTPPHQWHGPPPDQHSHAGDPPDHTPAQQWPGPPSDDRSQPLHQLRPPAHAAPTPPAEPYPAPPPMAGSGYRDDTRAFDAPRTDQPQRWQTAAPPEPSGARQGGQWPSGLEEPKRSVAGPNNLNYVDSIRTSELVPARKVPPGRGWRRVLYNATLGVVNLGQSRAELQQAELEAKIRTLLRGNYKIGVLGKGGVGKTTVAAAVGSIFAELRQDDRVVAIDADTAFGKLGARVDPQVATSYWDLAADQHLDTFADIRTRVGNNAAGLFVLPGESSTARRRVLDPAIYREATARLDRHFTISIVDCGSSLDAPLTQEALQDIDSLIVVSSPWVDGASAAGQTLEWLANRGMLGLLHRTVVVLNDSDGHANRKTRTILAQQFASRGQAVIEVPFDSHLRPGGVIDVANDMAPKTRQSFYETAAAIAEHFANTTQRPRGQRPR